MDAAGDLKHPPGGTLEEDASRRDASEGTRRPRTAAFLVRFWEEPEPTDRQGGGTVRGFVRNLHSGQEAYLAGPEELPRVVREAVAEAEPNRGPKPPCRPEDRSDTVKGRE